jgi:hypothetical protein
MLQFPQQNIDQTMMADEMTGRSTFRLGFERESSFRMSAVEEWWCCVVTRELWLQW